MLKHRTDHRVHTFRLAEVLRLIGVAALAGVALGYLFGGGIRSESLEGLARVACAVSLITVLLLIQESRRRQDITQIRDLLDERLERDRQWRAYAAALDDLGGIDGETSTDSGRLPRR